MSIKTNSLDYVIDKQKIEEKYDIFCLETSEKYIKRGAYILDVSVMCNDIKAIKFESGRKMLLLMSKNLDNKRKLKELLGEVTDGDKFSVLPVAISELKDHLLIQLLLNALGSYDSEFLKCNNLTGHTSVNGFMIDTVMSQDVVAGKKAITAVTFLSSSLEENSITDITSVETSFHIFDTEDWSNEIDTDHITINF